MFVIETNVCIGGPKDGEVFTPAKRCECRGICPHPIRSFQLRVPLFVEKLRDVSIPFEEVATSVLTRTETYFQDAMLSKDTEFRFWRHEDLEQSECMAVLLYNYKPEKVTSEL